MARYPVLLVLIRCLPIMESKMGMDRTDACGGAEFLCFKKQTGGRIARAGFIDYEQLEIFEFGGRFQYTNSFRILTVRLQANGHVLREDSL